MNENRLRPLYVVVSFAVAILLAAPAPHWFDALITFVVVFGGLWALLEKFGPIVLVLGILLYSGAGAFCFVQDPTTGVLGEPRPVMDHVCADFVIHILSHPHP
jgi:hypothetical protein